MPSSRQLSTFMQAQPKEPTAQEKPALSFDSTAYYQSLVDRNTRRGHAIRKCGKGMILGGGIAASVGFLSALLAEENRKDKEDFESDFSEMVNYSGAVMMIGGAAVLVSGFVVKSVGSSRLRRARRYQRKLDRYKMKQQHALEMQVFPLVDPVNGQFGGMLAMNF